MSEFNPQQKTTGTEAIAVLKAQSSALVLLCTFLTLGCLGFGYYAISTANKRAEEVKVAFVKLHPNGTYNISFYDSEQPFSLFQNTIDHLLRRAITARFKRDPATLQNDYNYFALFLSDNQLQQFLNEHRATTVVRDYLACPDCQIVHPFVRGIHHVDRDKIDLNDISAGVIVRSNIFLDLQIRNRNNGALIRTEKKIIPILWTLDMQKIRAGNSPTDLAMVILNENPIGLSILEYSMEDDLSGVAGGAL